MTGIRIVSEDGFTLGTKITDAETGAPIHGVSGITGSMKVNDVIRATVELAAVYIDTTAIPEYHVVDPRSGDLKRVKRVEFFDGDAVEFA